MSDKKEARLAVSPSVNSTPSAAPHIGKLLTLQCTKLDIHGTLEGNLSVFVDAVIVPEGKQSINALLKNGNAKYYLLQALKHLKAIGLQGKARRLYDALPLPTPDEGVGNGQGC